MRKGYARLTIDVEEKKHKSLKIMAATIGKSIKKVITDSIEKQLEEFKKIKGAEDIKNQE